MKRILVPTDFSKTSIIALEVACEIAKKAGADYLIILKIGRRTIAQKGSYYTNLEQFLFNANNSSLLAMNNAGSKITYDAGYIQTAIKDLEKCMIEVKGKLPFVYKTRKDVQGNLK